MSAACLLHQLHRVLRAGVPSRLCRPGVPPRQAPSCDNDSVYGSNTGRKLGIVGGMAADPCPVEPGGVSMLLSERPRNAVQPPGSRTRAWWGQHAAIETATERSTTTRLKGRTSPAPAAAGAGAAPTPTAVSWPTSVCSPWRYSRSRSGTESGSSEYASTAPVHGRTEDERSKTRSTRRECSVRPVRNGL